MSFNYIADENGFRVSKNYWKNLKSWSFINQQVESDAIPTPPPLPKEIADVWAKIQAEAAHAPQQQQQKESQQYQQYDNHLQQPQQQYYTKNY